MNTDALTKRQVEVLTAALESDSITSERLSLRVINNLVQKGLLEYFDMEGSWNSKRTIYRVFITEAGKAAMKIKSVPFTPDPELPLSAEAQERIHKVARYISNKDRLLFRLWTELSNEDKEAGKGDIFLKLISQAGIKRMTRVLDLVEVEMAAVRAKQGSPTL